MSSPPPSDPTVAYYDAHAEEFVRATLGVDMTALYEPFLAAVPAGGHILDAGCGSGRDARAFIDRGYRVTAFDASPALAKLAEAHVGQPVRVGRFLELNFEGTFDGVWACASLLHVPHETMAHALARLVRTLRPGGVLFVSFKRGEGEVERDGRRFTNYTPDALRSELGRQPALGDVRVWESPDVRPERAGERWVNALARRRSEGTG